MNQPLVSVLIPTYNRAHCLGRAIDSVLAQSHPHCEIVIVDDGSTDNTRELVAERCRSATNIRYVYQENQGVSAARNHALRIAKGDYLAFLDSDDVWQPWKLSVQLQSLAAFPDAGMCWTNMHGIDAKGDVFSEKYIYEMYNAYNHFTHDQLFSESRSLADVCSDVPPDVGSAKVYYGGVYSPMIMGNLVHTSTALMRRDRWEKVGFFDETMTRGGEDYDLHLRTCREGPVLFIDAPAIRYQTGMSDQFVECTENNIHFARCYLATITRAVAQDRARITLPNHMINTALFTAHSWIGEEALNQGYGSEARSHLFKSLWRKPFQKRTWMLFALSLLPIHLSNWMRLKYRRLRGVRTS